MLFKNGYALKARAFFVLRGTKTQLLHTMLVLPETFRNNRTTIVYPFQTGCAVTGNCIPFNRKSSEFSFRQVVNLIMVV